MHLLFRLVIPTWLLAPPFLAAAQPFPKPEPEKQFAELKVLDARDRPWRAAREDWAGAGSSPAVTPSRRERFYLELAAPAPAAQFTTTLPPAGVP